MPTTTTVVVQVLAYPSQALILDLSQANGYDVVSVSEGDRTWRRQTVDSPWVPGRVMTQKVLAQQNAIIVVRCRNSTWPGLKTLVNSARTAFENDSYLINATIGAVQEKWLCEAADSTLGNAGGELNQDEFMNWRQTLTLTCPRSPILVP